MESLMRGKCLCGSVEFELVGAVPKLYQCHCSLCRKQGGSSSNTATIVSAESLRWVCGKEHISSWIKDTGFRSDFCSICGSPVPNPLQNRPYYWVPVGLLEGDPQREIVAHVFLGSKASWAAVSPHGMHYETMPELSEFMALLHGGGNAE